MENSLGLIRDLCVDCDAARAAFLRSWESKLINLLMVKLKGFAPKVKALHWSQQFCPAVRTGYFSRPRTRGARAGDQRVYAEHYCAGSSRHSAGRKFGDIDPG